MKLSDKQQQANFALLCVCDDHNSLYNIVCLGATRGGVERVRKNDGGEEFRPAGRQAFILPSSESRYETQKIQEKKVRASHVRCTKKPATYFID